MCLSHKFLKHIISLCHFSEKKGNHFPLASNPPTICSVKVQTLSPPLHPASRRGCLRLFYPALGISGEDVGTPPADSPGGQLPQGIQPRPR